MPPATRAIGSVSCMASSGISSAMITEVWVVISLELFGIRPLMGGDSCRGVGSSEPAKPARPSGCFWSRPRMSNFALRIVRG